MTTESERMLHRALEAARKLERLVDEEGGTTPQAERKRLEDRADMKAALDKLGPLSEVAHQEGSTIRSR